MEPHLSSFLVCFLHVYFLVYLFMCVCERETVCDIYVIINCHLVLYLMWSYSGILPLYEVKLERWFFHREATTPWPFSIWWGWLQINWYHKVLLRIRSKDTSIFGLCSIKFNLLICAFTILLHTCQNHLRWDFTIFYIMGYTPVFLSKDCISILMLSCITIHPLFSSLQNCLLFVGFLPPNNKFHTTLQVI